MGIRHSCIKHMRLDLSGLAARLSIIVTKLPGSVRFGEDRELAIVLLLSISARTMHMVTAVLLCLLNVISLRSNHQHDETREVMAPDCDRRKCNCVAS